MCEKTTIVPQMKLILHTFISFCLNVDKYIFSIVDTSSFTFLAINEVSI